MFLTVFLHYCKLLIKMKLCKKWSVLVVILLIVNNCLAQELQGSFESKFNRYQKGQQFEGDESKIWKDVVWKGERLHKQIVAWANGNVNNITYIVLVI